VRVNGIGTANRTAFGAFRVIVTAGTWTLAGLQNRY
jgi:hypothetical protein